MNRIEANSNLKTVQIKGKDYVEVPERVRVFWELFPQGNIETEVISNDWNLCLVKATVTDGNGGKATGHAFEERKGMINTTSFIENCETSAVGRALGLFGIGSSASIATADEVKAAISAQTQNQNQMHEQAALNQAKQRLVDAERAYAKQEGATFEQVHAETMSQPDYEPTPEYLNRRARFFEKLTEEGSEAVRLEAARKRLSEAEKAYCEAHGVDFKEIHTQTLASRDYQNTPEWFERKAEEFEQEADLYEEEVSF